MSCKIARKSLKIVKGTYLSGWVLFLTKAMSNNQGLGTANSKPFLFSILSIKLCISKVFNP
jgi:hypothetical protein